MTLRSWYRRGVAAVAAAGLLSLGAAACGDSGGGGDASTVEWWHIQAETAEVWPAWEAFIEEFNEANPDGAQVNDTYRENEVFKEALATAMTANDPPDLFQSWGGGVLVQQVEAGLVRDLTDDLADIIQLMSPGALAPYTVDGRVYALPWTQGMVGIWYNQDLFEQAGITQEPATWPELLDAVEQLKAAGITPISLGGQAEWPGHFWWSYLAMRQAGLDAFLEVHETRTFDNPDFVQAGELLEELIALEPFQPGFLAAPYGEGPDGQAGIMGLGEAAMELMGHWGLSSQVENAGLAGADADAHRDRMGFMPFPEVPGGQGSADEVFGGGDAIAVGINAPDEALEFLRYMFSDENYQRILDADGGVVTTRAEPGELADPNMALVLEIRDAAPAFQLYLDQDYPEAVGHQVNQSVAALMAGASTPQQVVDEVNQAWASIG